MKGMRNTLYAMAFIAIIGCQNGSTTQNEYKNQSVVTETQQVREYSNEEKAFAGAAFGMSMNEVKSLEYYNDWRVEGKFLVNDFVELGFFTHYRGRLFFSKDDKLYQVVFQSPMYHTADKYDLIKSDLTTFKKIIEESYGKPTYSYGVPSIYKIKNGFNTAYVWEIGNKKIELSISKSSIDETYSFYGSIEDVAAMNKIRQEGKETIDKLFKDSSSLF